MAVTLASVGPPINGTLGLGLGSLNGTGTCIFSTTNLSAVAGSSAQITVTESTGQYCVEIYDLGNLTGTEAFTITIQHS